MTASGGTHEEATAQASHIRLLPPVQRPNERWTLVASLVGTSSRSRQPAGTQGRRNDNSYCREHTQAAPSVPASMRSSR